ncbi:Methyltransferase domain-containing protein [Promicromonospora umidemergens]|uniref:site-specific DNA-methyltransferase (adenine-specific) n=1 Tax=Promicromonospora umidemergens TaxID=629679 RepID=A0ABP8XSZ9_9MICO|nr:BREX-1 system adenine-specific DNA-methyltransferase PglX [Promicromonospora umidemergens]MCP2285142.1 Methyltransferase domain-containing protein [Promicromonospora umidemergens]
METAPLKSFATWARTALIREVTARIAVVLAPASPERVEQPKAVEALEKAVTAAGGGDEGKAAVADKVAYTWFNRIIALRFMDANGYTGVGVVSPQAGVETGQPEILAEAKRGNIDTTMVGGKTRERVTALLNGTRRSDDAQGEAYALLLADYCRHWNRAMPFMFEREGDFTELLIPANLLADDSVPSRAVKVLTTDVCQDVEVIGWLYQFYISERKDEVFAGFKKNKKAGADEIPAATQLFTPHWIVRYLVENSLGRLWMLNRPASRLVDQMQYYIAPVDEETDFLKIGSPEEIKVVDPACGSGHMLTYAFDLLYAIYEAEGYAPADIPALILTNNLYGVEIDPRAGALAAFALTMKARAKQRTFFNKQIEPNVCALDPIQFTPDEIGFLLTRGGDKHAEAVFWNQFEHADTLGSLIQPDAELTARLKRHVAQLDDGGDILLADVLDWAERVVLQAEYLSSRYHVAVANPPYMGSKNMDARLTAFAREQFPDSKSDLFAMFIERCLGLTLERGSTAMITMQSWMFISSFEALRKLIVATNPPSSMLHLGERGFDSIGGSVVSTTAFVLVKGGDSALRAVFVRAIHSENEAAKRAVTLNAICDARSHERFVASASSFAQIPGSPIAYWLPQDLRATFSAFGSLAEHARAAIGMITGRNATYVRQWWEVAASETCTAARDREAGAASGRKWFPYAKGGDFRRWAGNLETLVDWQNDGARLQTTLTPDGARVWAHNFNLDRIFRPGIGWTVVTTGPASFRVIPRGALFDAAAGILQSDDDLLTIGVLNSTTAQSLLSAINPTLNLHPGYLGALPVSEKLDRNAVRGIAIDAIRRAESDWNDFETSWDFTRYRLVGDTNCSLAKRLEECSASWRDDSLEQQRLEAMSNRLVAEAYGVEGEVEVDVPLHRVSLTRNVAFRYGAGKTVEEYSARERTDAMKDLVSYAIGCMFGRYSLDEPGLILADQGATVHDYLTRVQSPTFAPDKDNVIPIVDGDWFEDDIVARFRQFLRAAFGEQHFEENLGFVTESLGVKDIRDYFVKSFYKDHVQRYKKRPIYWLFSSPKGSFNALIYMHRYVPSTVSTVLNEYLREFRAKLTSRLQQQERLAAGGGTPRQQAAAQKEADRLRKVLLELEEYEHDVLYPLASRQLAIDLDDGVKANYPKFGAALKKIPGLEASNE